MALAYVAQSAVSIVIEKLISTAVSYVWERCAGPSAMQEEIQRLQQAFPRIQTILDMVERDQTVSTKQNKGLDAWLWQLRDAVDQAEDVLDEMEYYKLEKAVQAGDNKVQQGTALNLKRKFADFANNIFGNDDTLTRLREAVKALDNVAATTETLLQLVSQLYNSDVKRQQEDEIRNARETSSFLTEDTICGRNTEKERIVEWLTKPTSDEQENASATVGKVSAFAIVGMGGLGKTTLTQFIYHDEKVRQCFDLVMWVCVSDQFDVTMLTRQILEAAKVWDSLGDKKLNTIQEILKEKLISKKFLLVLDDVWNDDKILEWDKLVAPLKFGKKGSKILLTTRMDSVANTVARVLQGKKESLKLSGLKEDDFILLFNKHAFAGENIDDHKNLQLIGQQIARKLGGCPLAAKILGGYLNSCMDEKCWRRILNENFLNLKESEDNIRMILRLSYHHLPTSLQICFRYCSIFPEDHEFEKNELIRMWIGSGLIKKPIHEKRSLEDIGEEYINHLARKSLFDIKISEYGSNRKQRYVMHDLLHDLAQLVSSGECLGIEGDGSGDIPKTIRHIYVNKVNPHMISHLKNLRTLIIRLNNDYDVVAFNEVLIELKSLRFLRVVHADDYEFPDEVGKLIHLRYLSLSPWAVRENKISILPQSVCRLYHLEVMELWGMIKIDDSTLDGMSNLVKLRLLRTPYQEIMDRIPWIGKLTSLQELHNFHVREECGYKIDQLKNLQNLRKLHIWDLENVRSSEEAADANLIEKKYLDKLSLFWSPNHSVGLEVDEPLLDNLRPHTNLKELEIAGYAGVSSPHWMTAISSLSNVRSIKLSNCERWENLPPFGQLPLLKFLNLRSMRAVKKLWCSTSVGGCAFPSLEELELSRMPNLELFEGEHMFPLLKNLVITSCPTLKGLPALPLTLNKLNIWTVGLTSLPMMQQDCSSGEGRASCSSSSRPALSELIIDECPNLTSLDGFMLQQQYFPALKSLSIRKCDLRHLLEKFFQKLPSLEGLVIQMCPNITTHRILDDRLPETLERPTVVSSGDLDLSLLQESLPIPTSLVTLFLYDCASMTSLPPATVFPRLSRLRIWNCKELSSLDGLQSCPSLESLSIDGCASMTSLPPAEVYPRLSELHIRNCKELLSLDGLQALPSLQSLSIEGCDKLIELSLGVTSTSPTDMVLRPPMDLQIRNCKELSSLDGLQALPSLKFLSIEGCDKLIELSLLQPPLDLTSTSHTGVELLCLKIDRQALLRVEALRNLSSVSYLIIRDGTELTSLDEQWLLQNRNSLQRLEIHEASSLESLPTSMIHLQALRHLFIFDAPLLRTIPELPTSMKSLEISGCRPELKEHIEGSGKFANISCVEVTQKFPLRKISGMPHLCTISNSLKCNFFFSILFAS
ncbi:disease resistance protein RGA2-like [Ananas comosus]|uniref:Disease resistance protein RGA2-like n=1 Tax=Ananas comosus TaxID=4615 RepID=A0A6P5FNR3_ANACO|nr:disease resistance protein RGA2-like [Ananas comosus]